jgi:diaminopimelate epimerase
MELPFTKMHGLGNDFVVIDGYSRPVELSREQMRHIADRRFGVGCDQLLVVQRPDLPDTEFRYRIFNADGGEVEQCGNGARCFARYVRQKEFTDSDCIRVATASGRMELHIRPDGQVTVNMGIPKLDPADIPFDASARAPSHVISVDGETVEIGVVSMGNPHAIIEVPHVESAPVERLGRAIESHRRFPNRVNVGFMEIVDRSRIRLRVFERGVGETLACGSGACAAVVVGRLRDSLDENVTVQLRGGELVVSWPGENRPLLMTGPASFVFEGTIQL